MPYADPARQREYMRRWMAARRLAWLTEHGPCVDCGAREGLEVDHVDAATKVTHRVWGWSKPRRDAELVKCVVRCGPCHDKKTALNREKATQRCGEQNTRAKLSARQADEIRASSLTNAELARIYPVHPSTISRIRRGVRRSSEVDGAVA